jgi:hypothetical protein
MEQEMEDIILKHLSGQASAEENNGLLRWLNDSKANKRKFDAIRYTWEASGFVTSPLLFDANEGYSRIKSHIQTDKSGSGKKLSPGSSLKKFTFSSQQCYLLIADLLLIASMVWMIWKWWDNA